MTAHVGGLPVEETLALYGPALLVVLGAAWTTVRAKVRRPRGRRRAPLP